VAQPQALTHANRVALAALGERPRDVGDAGLGGDRLGVAQ
jgi:hypothetical protein